MSKKNRDRIEDLNIYDLIEEDFYNNEYKKKDGKRDKGKWERVKFYEKEELNFGN